MISKDTEPNKHVEPKSLHMIDTLASISNMLIKNNERNFLLTYE